MDFIEGLFDFGDRNRRKRGGFFQNDSQHGQYNDDYDDDQDHHNQYSNNSIPQDSTKSAATLVGVICNKCSTQTVLGAKFCHGCGATIEVNHKCSSCGSLLPVNAQFCAQCGCKNG